MKSTLQIVETTFSPLPSGYQMRKDGVFREMEGKEGKTTWTFLCSTLRVIAMVRDARGSGWGRLVEVINPDGVALRRVIPAKLFAAEGAELRTILLDMGLTLASTRASKDALTDLLQRWKPPARLTTVDRLGWTDESCSSFVCGDGRVLGAETVMFVGDDTPALAAEMKPAGTLEDWVDGVARFCIRNPLMSFAVSLGFAGPLLEPLGMDGGGAHLRGASSRGKSTLQRVAVSVWGSPRLFSTWRATTNGLEGVAVVSNSSLLALDEIGEVSGRDVGNAVYMLANGSGKTRANRNGVTRPSARWKVMVLSSGEVSLANKMAEAESRPAAGQEVRLLDIVADDREHGAFDFLHGLPDGAAFADHLRHSTSAHYGVAGPAFVTRFLEKRDEATTTAKNAIRAFRDEAVRRWGITAEGQVERVLTRLGLVAFAGELATSFGLTGWQKGEARDAAFSVFDIWLQGRDHLGPTEAHDAIARVREFIVRHGDTRFEPRNHTPDRRPIINRAGWKDDDTFAIAPDVWKNEVHKGSDPVCAARHLEAAGFLVRGDGRNLTQRLTSVKGKPRVYVVRMSILGAGSD